MTTDPFTQPATPGDSVEWQALKGSLLLVKVLALEPHVPTVHTLPGEKTPAIRADIDVVDGQHAGEVHEDALVFPRVLQSQLKRSIGQTVIGRLVQGVPKPGQTAPWTLQEVTPADMDAARQYLSRKTGATVTSAQPPF